MRTGVERAGGALVPCAGTRAGSHPRLDFGGGPGVADVDDDRRGLRATGVTDIEPRGHETDETDYECFIISAHTDSAPDPERP